MAKFGPLGLQSTVYTAVWTFGKIRGIWKMLLERKALLSNNFFHTNLLIFFKISNCHKISFLNDGGPKLGYFDIFDMLFPFLKFAKLWPIILWKVGHVMAWLQGAYWLEEWKAFVDFVGIKNATFKAWQYNPLSLARATLKVAEI